MRRASSSKRRRTSTASSTAFSSISPTSPAWMSTAMGFKIRPSHCRTHWAALSPFRQLDQNDARFMAYWGVDTYVRDWKILVDKAREEVGPEGLVLFGGHSMGTEWAGIFAAYDFDPGPGVDAGLPEDRRHPSARGGWSPEPPSRTRRRTPPTSTPSIRWRPPRSTPTKSFCRASRERRFRSSGPAAELAGLDGTFRPGLPSLLQRTALFQTFPLSIVVISPLTSETLIALFLDNNTSPVAELAGSFGFSDDGPNSLFPAIPSVGILLPVLPSPPEGRRSAAPLEELQRSHAAHAARPSIRIPRWTVGRAA